MSICRGTTTNIVELCHRVIVVMLFIHHPSLGTIITTARRSKVQIQGICELAAWNSKGCVLLLLPVVPWWPALVLYLCWVTKASYAYCYCAWRWQKLEVVVAVIVFSVRAVVDGPIFRVKLFSGGRYWTVPADGCHVTDYNTVLPYPLTPPPPPCLICYA